jgi:hypothetical protein
MPGGPNPARFSTLLFRTALILSRSQAKRDCVFVRESEGEGGGEGEGEGQGEGEGEGEGGAVLLAITTSFRV